MRKNVSLPALRAVLMVLLVVLGVGNAWAGGGSTTYYANLTISKTGETGKGKVYYATSNSKPSSETSGALKSSGSTTQNANQTYYWWVDVDPGYNVKLSGKITAGPATAATLSGNVACAQSSSSGSGTSYTATANIVAVTVNSVDNTSITLNPTNPSTDYPFTVTFGTSNLKTIAIDLDKSPETTDGKFTITNWSLYGTNVVANGKFNGGGSYGGASRNHSTTVSLQSKASGSAAKTCTVTANFPAMAFVSVEADDVFATQGESGKTGSATFKYNYAAEDDFPTTPTLVPTSGTGAFTVTGYTVTPDFAKGETTVTVNYSFDTNNGIGETPATLTLTAANGDVRTVTLIGHSEALATNDASVTTTANVTTEYETFAQALAAANATSGATLTLLRNVDLGTITTTNNINKAMTIDLNGKELRAAVNATDVGILTIAKAVAVTIKDSKTGGKIINEIARNSAIRTIFVNKAGATLTLESGTIAVNNLGQYASAANSTLGVAKYANCTARAIHQIAGTTVNINGGRVEAYGTRSVYGIVQASSVATNVAGTSVLNITDGEIYAEGPYAIYGICAYGKVNFSNGAITTHVNTNMVDARYAADATQNKYNGNGYGIYMGASSSAAAASCYYGTLEMTGGTVSVTNDRTLNGNYPNYGVYLHAAATNVSSATAVAADGKSRGQIASAKASIDGGEISVISGTQYSHGVYVLGSYNSYDNSNHTVQIKNCKITSKAYVCAYGVSAWGAINTTNGACYAGDVELTNCDVYAESLNTTTASAVWVYATSATIFKDGTTTNAATWGGEFAVAGKAVINSGKYEAKTKTTTAMAVGTSSRAKTVYDPITTVQANRIPGGNAEAYPILIIHGGTFKATSTTTTARGVSNGGYCTIDGGTFEAYATTTAAHGLYCLTGKITASGVTISASATGTAYGAYADVGIPTGNTAQTGFAYAGEIELNNCDITATTRTSTEARGVVVNATNKMHTWAGLKSDSTSNKWATTTYNAYKSVFPCTIAGHDSVGIAIAAKATINGCDIKATAATTTAYGVYSTATSVPASADSVASPVVNIKNTKFTVKTNGTTTAYGVYAGGPITIDGCDFTVQPKTTTAYGVYVYDKKTTITNTTFDVKGTTTAYGIYANAAIGSTTGWDYHGEVELGEGNDMTVAATSGDAAHVLTLIATKRNIATGKFAGNYANAASAHIIGGKYKATATGAKSYVLNLSDQQVQGDVISRPACIIEDGKFWALASGGTTGICSANGQIGHIVLKGGFYNVNTNLAKYKGEGKNVNDVLSGTPEYTEGYRYKISSELSGSTVCKVYQGNTEKAAYATLEEALQYVNANTGTTLTIVMVADYTLKKGDYLLPANATLVVPKELSQKAAIGTTPTREAVSTPAPVQFLMLTFDAGVNMTAKGTIETSAVNTAANGGSAITGAPTGNYGRLHLVEGSTITLESGANLNCWGYTTGKGEIDALNGSVVREGFQLGFWRGGSATSSMLSNRNTWHAFPVTDYFIQNVEAPITFRPGAQLLGYSGVNVSIVGVQAADNVKLVGTSKSMFLMETADASEDTYVRKEYDPATDRSIWTVNSGAKIGSFSFSLAGNTVNSADYYLPISNNMTINVNEGEFTVTQDVLQIPGSVINISKLGKLTIASGSRLFVMDNEDWPGFLKSGTTTVSRWYYNALYSPSWTTNPRTTAYPPTTTRLPDAEIFVHGETEGSYYTSTHGANIHSTNDDAGKVKFIAAAGADNSIQHVVNTDNERVTINFTTAQLKNETPETPYTSTVGTVAGEAYTYMESQWVKVTDGCLMTRTDGSGTHEYAKPSDAVEVVSNGDNAYRDAATNLRYFINTEKALNNDECVWWEVAPVTSGTYAGDYMANQEKYENYGAYYYWDGSAGYWKPRFVTVTWKNQDGSTLATYTNVMYNTSPKYLSASPTWANTNIEKHDWVGWRDEEGNIYDKNATLPAAQGNVTYTAYFNTSKYEYTITFKNPDNTVIWAGLVEAGIVPVCPVEPTQASTISTNYRFTGWNTTPVAVTGTATYTAVYANETRQYHVTFYNYDAASVLYEADVDYNTRPVYGGVTPFRANTSAFSYEWTGWQHGATHYGTSDELALVVGDVYYVATFNQTDLKYQVFFKRQDGSIIDAPFFNYEEMPAAFPANPTLASTVSTDYTFDHWDPATLQPVTVDGMVYMAHFSESPRQYTAHFVNYNGASLGVDQTIDYNMVPAYTGAIPFKPNDSRNSFEFSGWAWEAGANWEAGSISVGEAFPAIKGDITFTAQFTETLLQFNVLYVREDGTIILQDKKKWGESTAFPSPVASYEDDSYTYTFDHWSPATVVNPVTADATYTAYFNQAIKTYSISAITATPAGYGTVSQATISGIPSGSAVTVNGNTFTVNGTTITATPTAADAQYTYTFDHWNNVPATVTGNVTNVEAVFIRTVNTYTVTWKNGDVTLETDENVAYGTTPTYNGETPTKAATAEYTYTFNNWSPTVSSVTGDATYTATFTSSKNSYEITWLNDDNSLIDKTTVEYGVVPTHADATKANTAEYTYTFTGWDNTPVAVTGAATYKATFSSTLNNYTLTIGVNEAGYGTVNETSVTVPYGTAVSTSGNTLTIGSTTVTATPTTNTAEYSYAFSEWQNVPATVAGNVDNIQAVFTRTLNTVTITWKNGDDIIETDEGVVIGSTPSFDSETPTKITDATYGYIFDGWDDGTNVYAADALPAVSGAVTYTAHYTTTPTVASVTISSGTTYYTTLQAAFDYAGNKTTPTINVLSDIALSAKVTFTGSKATNVTFELNGYKVSGAVDQLLYITGSKAFTFIIQDSSVGQTGQIYTRFSSNKANKCCVYVYYGTVELRSGKIYMENTSTGANVTAYGVLVRSGSSYIFNMTGGTIEVKSTKHAHAIYSQGTTTITGGTLKATETKNGYASGVHVASGTTTISGNPTFNISGTQYVNGVRVGGLTPKLNSKKTAVTKYNGVANIEGGTYTVTASSNTAYGVYCYGNIFALDYATNATVPGNYACAGTANVRGGEFTVTSSGATAYGVCLQEPTSIQTALDADGNATYAAATTNPKATITGGKFNVSGTSSVGAVNTAASNTALDIQGGWYNIDTNLSGYVAPTKSCNYHVLNLPDSELPYKYEVAEAYKVSWDATTNGGSCETPYTLVKKSTAIGTVPEATKTGYDFLGWFTTYTTGGTEVTAATVVTHAMFAYARFAPSTYDITYKDQGDVDFSGVHGSGYPTTHTYGTETALVNPTKTGYTFGGWYDNADCTGTALTEIGATAYTANFTLYAKWTADEVGPNLDIVDWTWNSDTGEGTATINANGWKAAGWPYTITISNNSAVYYKDETAGKEAGSTNYRAEDRTLTISHSVSADWRLEIIVTNKDGVIYSKHSYVVPHVFTTETTTSGWAPSSILFVRDGAKLTINANAEVNAVYVSPEAELEVSSGVTLTVDTLILRTTPWTAAVLENEGTITATKTYYTRIVKDNSGYFQFALPLASSIKSVHLSDFSKCTYGTSWILKSYSESSRAANGNVNTESVTNWVMLPKPVGEADVTIAATTGYELYSNSKYYREFYFPVDLSTAGDKTKVRVLHTDNGAAGEANAGWNALCSPMLGKSKYDNPKGDPADALKVSVLEQDGRYNQQTMNTIAPAVPFYYQASTEGDLNFTPKASAPRRAWNTQVLTQWLQLTLNDDKGRKLDETNIYINSDRFDASYETGYDVAKQSLTGGKATLYTELACGKLAFAAISDSIAECRIPLTVYAAADKEYTFSMVENNYLGRFQYVLLYDNETGSVADLLSGDYTCELTQGTISDRFYIQCVFIRESPAVTTGDGIGVESSDSDRLDIQKIVYKEKVYIIYKGRVYDMTGRQCELH